MNPKTQVLLGYSARVPISRLQLKEEQRRNLFRTQLKALLSVDEMIWPDVFFSDPRRQHPEWVGYIQGLWASLPRLLQTAAVAGLRRNRDYTIVAVTVLLDRSHQNRWMTRIGDFDPPYVRGEAVSLGFDVADEYLMSGLCNSVFLPGEDPEALRRQWGAGLNDFHLFIASEKAEAFVPVAEQRFPEHAPFFSFEMLHVESEETSSAAGRRAR